MPQNFYKNFTYKPTDIKDNDPKPVENDQAFLSMSIGTLILRSTGEEYKKVGTNIFDKSPRKILSYDEIRDNYPESDGDNIFEGDNNFQGDVTVGGDTTVEDIHVKQDIIVNGTITGPSGTFDKITVNNKLDATNATITNITSSSIMPPSNNTGSIGSSSNKWGSVYADKFYGVATAAQYSDLAENYRVDKLYQFGTVLQFSETDNVLTEFAGGTLAGVISTDPGFKLNYKEKNGQYVALKGIVPVFCEGDIKIGQYCIAVPGGKVIGKNKADMTLQDMLDCVGVCFTSTYDSDFGRMCVVKV